MRLVIFTVFAIITTLSPIVAPLSGKGTPSEKKSVDQPAAPTDQMRIQGLWKPISLEDLGKQMPAQELAKLRINFTADQAIVGMGDESKPAGYKIDTTKNPREIDIMPSTERPVRGIYKFDGDRLIIRFSERGARPKDFESDLTKDEGRMVLIQVK